MTPGTQPPGRPSPAVYSMALAPFLVLAATTHLAHASGFRITNQSLGAVGLSGAHIAYTPGPDASYYNPANMAFQPDQWRVETSLTALDLPSITYTDNRSPLMLGDSETELFFMPLIHAVSPQYGRLRFGFSLTYPYGLAKQWSQPYPSGFAEKFSLLTVEANPTMAVRINDWLSIGGGISCIYGKGEVDNTLTAPYFPIGPLTSLNRSAEATDTQLGYNLALSLRPTERWNIAATYRSEVQLDLSGNGRMWTTPNWITPYAGGTSLGLTLPAVFSLATSHTWDKLTVELGWDRTFWSAFKTLDFAYDTDFTGSPYATFDSAITKNWKDTNAYRLGLTYDWNETWTTTLGFTYDETPVPDATLGFELPDTDATVYCAGVRYRASTATEIGLSYMYHRTRSRSVSNAQGVDGTFTDGGAHAVTIGLITTF